MVLTKVIWIVWIRAVAPKKVPGWLYVGPSKSRILPILKYVLAIHALSSEAKFQTQVFYSYQNIAIWKVDKMQTQILQTRILNDHSLIGW